MKLKCKSSLDKWLLSNWSEHVECSNICMVYYMCSSLTFAGQVLIFSEKKQDVDAIHEYLLLKGVEAVSIHGGKDQEERTQSVQQFRNRQKDVLVATDVASKGLDFPDIHHVINYDMPEDIENYGLYIADSLAINGKCSLAWLNH